MANPQLHDTVRVLRDLPGGTDGIDEAGQRLAAGAVGTVVFVFDTPSTAYEVEFVDEAGRTTGVRTLTGADLEAVSLGGARGASGGERAGAQHGVTGGGAGDGVPSHPPSSARRPAGRD